MKPAASRIGLIVAIGWMVLAAPIRGDDLFQVRAFNTLNQIIVSGNSLPDLVENIVKAEDRFAVFSGTAYSSILNYGGVDDALALDVNATGTQAVLTSRLTGLRRVFAGSSRDEVQDQIEDYLTEDADQDLADLYKELNARSLVAVTDGNPHSSTALVGSQTFRLFAMSVGRTQEERERPAEYAGRFSMGVVPDIGFIDAGGFSGMSFTLPVDIRVRASERVAVVLSLPINYTQIEDAEIFQLGFGVGVPIKLLRIASAESPWTWQITPSVGAIGSGSYDLAAGGLLIHGALSSVLSYELPRCTLSLGNQFGIFEGQEIAGFDPGVSQQLTKHGLQLSVPVGRRSLIELYGIYSRYLDDAAVPDYFTVGADYVYRMLGNEGADKAGRGYLFGGVYADLADNYTAPHVRAGTGWRF